MVHLGIRENLAACLVPQPNPLQNTGTPHRTPQNALTLKDRDHIVPVCVLPRLRSNGKGLDGSMLHLGTTVRRIMNRVISTAVSSWANNCYRGQLLC